MKFSTLAISLLAAAIAHADSTPRAFFIREGDEYFPLSGERAPTTNGIINVLSHGDPSNPPAEFYVEDGLFAVAKDTNPPQYFGRFNNYIVFSPNISEEANPNRGEATGIRKTALFLDEKDGFVENDIMFSVKNTNYGAKGTRWIHGGRPLKEGDYRVKLYFLPFERVTGPDGKETIKNLPYKSISDCDEEN